MGATIVSWSCRHADAAVYVAADGGGEKLFAQGSADSVEAPWIQAASTYEFRLYSNTTRKQLLARVIVTGTK